MEQSQFENVYQETDFDEEQEKHVGPGSEDDGGSSSESDFEYIPKDSLLGQRASLPRSSKNSTDLNCCEANITERRVSSDDSMIMTFVDCDFRDVGCEARLPRREMTAHLEQAVVYHLSIQAEAMRTLRNEKEELAAKYERLELKYQHLEGKVNELLNAVEKLANGKDPTMNGQTLDSKGDGESLGSQHNGSKDCPCQPKSSTKSVSHSLLPVLPKPSSSRRPLSASSSFPLSKDEAYVDDGYVNDDEMPELQTRLKSNNEENWQYPYTPVEPTSPSPLQEVKQQSQTPTILTVTNFERLKKSGGTWISRPFYTHSQGYKMCLRVIANGKGSGKGTHITVAVYLMKGEFDDQLEWPFKGDITVQLLNQQGDKGHYTRTIRGAEAARGSGKSSEKFISAWGIHQFKSHGEVYQRFLKNDSLKFQVTTVIKPPTLSSQTIKTQL